MNTHPNADPRAATTSGRHLRLVADPETSSDDDHDQLAGRHAKPVRKAPLAGSATVRALMALGALASALGVAIGRAEAHPVLSEPVEQVTPEPHRVPMAAGADKDTGNTTARSTTPRATTAGQWTPTARPAARTYTTEVTPGKGRHRRPYAQQDENRVLSMGSGQRRTLVQRREGGEFHTGSGRHRRQQAAQNGGDMSMDSDRWSRTASAGEAQPEPGRYVRAVAHR